MSNLLKCAGLVSMDYIWLVIGRVRDAVDRDKATTFVRDLNSDNLVQYVSASLKPFSLLET